MRRLTTVPRAPPRRGVLTAPSTPPRRLSPLPPHPAVYGKGGFSRATLGSITNRLAQAGNGARGIVAAYNKGATVGHFFNAVNQGGRVVFIDAQTGRIASTAYDSFMFLLTHAP